MRRKSIPALIAVAILASFPIATYAGPLQDPSGDWSGKKSAATASSAVAGLPSGIYGFSGALKGGGVSGAIGECIWIYDSTNRRQVAKGDCDEGKFRVPLQPGRYVVRGPGGNQKIDLKPHEWIKIESLATLPGAF